MIQEGGESGCGGRKRETDIRGGEECENVFSFGESFRRRNFDKSLFPLSPPLLTPDGIDRSIAAGIGANESTTCIF